MQKTVLVVDDDPLYIDLLCDVVSTDQYNVLTAVNGLDALDVLERNKVDLIVSDVEMPLMDGIALYARTRESEKLKRIPFVFLSGTIDSNKLGYITTFADVRLIRKTNLVDELLPVIAKLM